MQGNHESLLVSCPDPYFSERGLGTRLESVHIFATGYGQNQHALSVRACCSVSCPSISLTLYESVTRHRLSLQGRAMAEAVKQVKPCEYWHYTIETIDITSGICENGWVAYQVVSEVVSVHSACSSPNSTHAVWHCVK